MTSLPLAYLFLVLSALVLTREPLDPGDPRPGSWLRLSTPSVTAPAHDSSPEQLPTGLSASDWANIRAAHAAAQLAFHPTEGGFEARTPSQAWVNRFDGQGFTITPDSGAWSWGLELAEYGWGDALVAVDSAAGHIGDDGRLEFPRDERLTEWYRNDERGLEQGFTLASRPEGALGHLRLELELRGGLEPRLSPSARDMAFGQVGEPALVRYDGLRVFDVTGQDLAARFEVGGAGLRLCVEDQHAVYPLTIDPIAQQAYLKASNSGLNDQFGCSVAVSGNTAVVGALFEDSAATGVNSLNQGDNSASASGAAYVFQRNGSTWKHMAYLKASNTQQGDYFGASVAIFGDTIAVGASGEDSNASGVDGDQTNNSAGSSGAVYVFECTGGLWSQQAYLKASNTATSDRFGSSLALSGDTLVVGAHLEDSVANGVNGDQTSNGAPDSGAAYVFVRNAGIWTQQAYLKASNTGDALGGDNFGHSVAISGDTLVVGAWAEDSQATGVNGNQAGNAAPSSGAAYVFLRTAGSWSQQAYLKASNTDDQDWFGWTVGISGDTIAVGAPSEDSSAKGIGGDQSNNALDSAGAVYVFERDGSTWSQKAYIKASNSGKGDEFGAKLALSGEILAVGARFEDSSSSGVNGLQTNNSALNSGATYVFQRTAGVWNQIAYIKASNTDPWDQFGSAVGASGELVLSGAIYEGSGANGVNGNQANNSSSSGAAYLLDLGLGLGAQNYGTGTPGCAGAQVLGVNHAPMIGSPGFALTCSNAPPFSAGFGVLASAPDLLGSDPFGLGVLLHVDPLSSALVALPFSSDALGKAVAPAPIPNSPGLVGKTLYAQVLWAWSSCSLPPFDLSTSNGLALTFLMP